MISRLLPSSVYCARSVIADATLTDKALFLSGTFSFWPCSGGKLWLHRALTARRLERPRTRGKRGLDIDSLELGIDFHRALYVYFGGSEYLYEKMIQYDEAL